MEIYSQNNTERIEIDEISSKKKKLRAVVAIFFMALAIAAITYGILSLFSTDPGWRVIEAASGVSEDIGGNIVFRYNTGQAGLSARSEYRLVKDAYAEAVTEASKSFGSDYYSDTANLFALNSSPNTEVEINDELYAALELIRNFGGREIYLAPIYEYYTSIFFAGSDSEAEVFDPYKNSKAAEYFAELCKFANDADSIGIKLNEERRAELYVSEEYLAYAEENGITEFISLGYIKNALAVDFISEKLTSSGYTHGNLSTVDGFVRNLDSSSDEAYSYNIFAANKEENTVTIAARLDYTGSIALVSLRSFPVAESEMAYYYVYSDGEVRHSYIDASDGLCKANYQTAIAYSDKSTCSQLYLMLLKSYTGETPLEGDGCGTLISDNGSLSHTKQGDISVTILDSKFTLNEN